MPKKIYIGDPNQKGQQVRRIYIGDSNNKAQKIKAVYLGDSNGKAQLTYCAHESTWSEPHKGVNCITPGNNYNYCNRCGTHVSTTSNSLYGPHGNVNEYYYLNDATHEGLCEYCENAIVTEPHTFDKYVSTSDTTHAKYCNICNSNYDEQDCDFTNEGTGTCEEWCIECGNSRYNHKNSSSIILTTGYSHTISYCQDLIRCECGEETWLENHHYDYRYESDGNGDTHGVYCSRCNERLNTEPCVDQNPETGEYGPGDVCMVCGGWKHV